jgi:hypothetical protein
MLLLKKMNQASNFFMGRSVPALKTVINLNL